MIDMGNKKSDIILGLSCLSITMVFMWGMIKWPYFTKDSWWYNLYYLCTSSALYALSLVINITARTFWFKVGSAAGITVFGMNLYIELFRDPKNWSKFDFVQLIIVGLTSLLVIVIIEKLKQKKCKT